MSKKAPDSITEPARRLRSLLAENNLTQKELAERIHVDARYVSMIACSTRGMSRDMASRISACFPGTRVQWLLGFDDYQTESQKVGEFCGFIRDNNLAAENMIRSHGYDISRIIGDENKVFFKITSPKGEVKVIPAQRYNELISRINDYVEGELLLGFHRIKDGVKEYRGGVFSG